MEKVIYVSTPPHGWEWRLVNAGGVVIDCSSGFDTKLEAEAAAKKQYKDYKGVRFE